MNHEQPEHHELDSRGPDAHAEQCPEVSCTPPTAEPATDRRGFLATGKMLAAQNRDPFRPAHLHVLAHKENYKTLISQIYSDDDPNLENDVAFGVTEALIGNFQLHEDANDELNTSGPWYSLSHELVMEAGVSELPLPPIR